VRITLTYDEHDVRQLVMVDAANKYAGKEIKITAKIAPLQIYIEVGEKICSGYGGKD